MRFRILALVVGVAIASGMVLGAAIPSGAQVVATCTATTATFVQAAGSSSAPILVPMNLPVSVCTLPHHVQVIIPAFRVAGAQPASIIVPSRFPVTSCSVSAALSPSAMTSSVQVITVSGSTVTVLSPVTVVAPPLVTCF